VILIILKEVLLERVKRGDNDAYTMTNNVNEKSFYVGHSDKYIK